MSSEEKARTRANLAPLLGFLALILLFGALASYILAATAAFWVLLILGVGILTAFVALNAKIVSLVFVSRQSTLRCQCSH